MKKTAREKIDAFTVKYPKLTVLILGVVAFVVFSLLNQLGNPNNILNP